MLIYIVLLLITYYNSSYMSGSVQARVQVADKIISRGTARDHVIFNFQYSIAIRIIHTLVCEIQLVIRLYKICCNDNTM